MKSLTTTCPLLKTCCLVFDESITDFVAYGHQSNLHIEIAFIGLNFLQALDQLEITITGHFIKFPEGIYPPLRPEVILDSLSNLGSPSTCSARQIGDTLSFYAQWQNFSKREIGQKSWSDPGLWSSLNALQ